MDDVAADVDLHVDVHGPALVPARIDAPEEGKALRVRLLQAAHEGPVAGSVAEAGVDAGRVGVPDVHDRALDRPARACVDDRRPEPERRAGPPFGDVAAQLLAGEVVRALRLLGREDAAHGVRVVGSAAELPSPDAEHRRSEPAQPDERGAPREARVTHRGTPAS